VTGPQERTSPLLGRGKESLQDEGALDHVCDSWDEEGREGRMQTGLTLALHCGISAGS